jgi:nicotinamidase-related amidase
LTRVDRAFNVDISIDIVTTATAKQIEIEIELQFFYILEMSSETNSIRTALVVIDVQQGFDNVEHWGGKRNNPNAEQNMLKILAKWRENKWPIAHVQHCSTELSSPLHADNNGCQFQPGFEPIGGEKHFRKSVNSAFIGTELEAWLGEIGVRRLVIVGLTTDHCVSTSTRMAGNLGFDVTLVSDATATFQRRSHDDSTTIDAEQVHNVHLASLHNEFCVVKTTEQVL